MLALNVGGTGEFASADVATIGGLGTPTGGFPNGSFLGLDTTAGSTTVAAAIGNANTVGVIKLGANTLTLTGASTYTGPTAVFSGTLSVASLNSVVGGTAASNLGAPTAAANGVIALGSGTNAVGLTYTGTGETSDRVIDLA